MDVIGQIASRLDELARARKWGKRIVLGHRAAELASDAMRPSHIGNLFGDPEIDRMDRHAWDEWNRNTSLLLSGRGGMLFFNIPTFVDLEADDPYLVEVV